MIPTACMCVYQEARLLPMALGCLPDPPVLVVDGAYQDYPHVKPYSTDGTIEIARAYGARTFEVRDPWPDQVAKRTFAIHEAAKESGVVFVVDADEVVEGAYPSLPDGYDVGWVWVRNPIYETPYLEPRVFRVGNLWRYDKRHHWIYDGRQFVCSHRKAGSGYKHVKLGTTIIHNMRDWRSSKRLRDKHLYGVERNKAELKHGSET